MRRHEEQLEDVRIKMNSVSKEELNMGKFFFAGRDCFSRMKMDGISVDHWSLGKKQKL